MDSPAPAPPYPPQPGVPVLDLLESGPDAHAAELRRLELLRAKADTVQSITTAIMIMALGTTGFVLLVLAVAKLATL